MVQRYVGLMTGTSLDAVDAVLVEFDGNRPRLLAARSTPLAPDLRAGLAALTRPGEDEIHRLLAADTALGEALARAVLELLEETGTTPAGVRAIGSHGQTVRHCPDPPQANTLQIGNPAIIALRTGITTVADFRRADLAAGGQGAPLAPAFHAACFRDPGGDRVVVNIGGMANLTVLPADAAAPVTGFDTGPGNVLMDLWAQRHLGVPYDDGGAWAASGKVIPGLLETLLGDAYFERPPPKSTGREHFDEAWLERHLAHHGGLAPEDIQATLCELTAASIAHAVEHHAPPGAAVYVCGGGARNTRLMARLAARLPGRTVGDTGRLGLDPRWVEAAAFAWLARERLAGRPANLPSVTGAARPVLLGAIHAAPSPGT